MEEYILLISLRDILNNIALDEIVYALYPKEYWIQPLSHSKTGVELCIGEDTSVTDTLWGTAGQVADILQEGSDFKNLIKYFQRQRQDRKSVV